MTEDKKNILQKNFHDKQTPQAIGTTIASCYNYVHTKTLHFDLISLQENCFKLESLQAEVGQICIGCWIHIEWFTMQTYLESS